MTTPDNRALWELVEKLTNLARIMAGGDGTKRIDTPAWDHLLELTNELREILERHVVVGGWLPIESAPDDHEDRVLYLDMGAGVVIGCRARHMKGRWYCEDCDEYVNPIAWFRIPEPPTTEALESMVRGKS